MVGIFRVLWLTAVVASFLACSSDESDSSEGVGDAAVGLDEMAHASDASLDAGRDGRDASRSASDAGMTAEDTADEDSGDGDAPADEEEGEASPVDAASGDAEDAEAAPVDAGATEELCGAQVCDSVASCEDTDDGPRCVCPAGYEDVAEDGSECKDILECEDEALNDCAAQADCEEVPGGYTCTCPDPVAEGDGRTCACADGYAPDPADPQRCVGPNGARCELDAHCSSGACVGGICCAGPCVEPDVCESTRGATCEDGSTCVYPLAEVGEKCTDGDACTDDACDGAGNCVGTAFDPLERCTQGNDCQAPACDSAQGCIYSNAPVGTPCDDSDPCTVTDACNELGVCTGSGLPEACDDGNECTEDVCTAADNAQGFSCSQTERTGACDPRNACASAGVCSGGLCQGIGNSCGAGDPSCMPGPPRVCQCAEPAYVLDSATGNCVPSDDECAVASPCVEQALCTDPSAVPGDALCSCPAGLVGDGRQGGTGCLACEGNTKAINGACVCDLGGVFAMRFSSAMSWDEGAFEEANSVGYFSWSLRTHEYDSQGNLQVTEQACGGTTPDICVPFFEQALSGNIPYEAYDSGRVAAEARSSLVLPNAVPGAPFVTPPEATLVGLTLPSNQRLTYWPEDWQEPGINWVDADQDGVLGITTLWRGSGTSEVCPREGSGPRLDYDYPPVLAGIAIHRVREVYGATRLISSLSGSIVDCDTVAGDVYGLAPGQPMQASARVVGCQLENGDDCQQTDTRLIDFLDDEGANTPQRIERTTFVMKRLPPGMAPTCQNVRALDYSVP